jgi:hypothetical protein
MGRLAFHPGRPLSDGWRQLTCTSCRLRPTGRRGSSFRSPCPELIEERFVGNRLLAVADANAWEMN